jgi:bacterioferritin
MNSKSVELLNKALADEMSAVHQYMYFHLHCDNEELGPIAQLFKRTAIEEMTHVERLGDRILFLKGEVEMAASTDVQKITNVYDMLKHARKMEEDSVKEYNLCTNICSHNSDAISKQLFESLIADEERHYNQFDKELNNIDKFGDQYLALQAMEKHKKN